MQPGSVLIVESLDRLSRDQIRPALTLFLNLQDLGITIVTLQPEREYSPDNPDALALIEPLIVFARAHEESAMKSHRRRHGWEEAKKQARQGKGLVARTAPAWLAVDGDGFRIKEKEAAAVRRIFALARDGMGVNRITERLVRDGVPPIFGRRLTGEEVVKHRKQRDEKKAPLTPAEVADLGEPGRWMTTALEAGGKTQRVRTWKRARWVKAYVYKILVSAAAIGTYQPCKEEGRHSVPDGEPIPDYYPPIIAAEEWEAAQAAVKQRAAEGGLNGRFKKGGRPSPAAGRKGVGEPNLFTGLLRCGRTGEAMHLVHARGKLIAGVKKHYRYLVPTRETAVSGGQRITYDVFEDAVLSLLKELKPSDVMGVPPAPDSRAAELSALSGQLLDLDSRLQRAKGRAATSGDFDALLDVITGLTAERRRVSERRGELEREENERGPADLGEMQGLIDLLAAAPDDEREDLRRRLKARLRELVAGMWAVVAKQGKTAVCAMQLYFRATDTRRDYLIIHKPGTKYGPGRWWARSLSSAVEGVALDLRRRENAAALARRLEALDLKAITAPA